jgi:hypothetical protein
MVRSTPADCEVYSRSLGHVLNNRLGFFDWTVTALGCGGPGPPALLRLVCQPDPRHPVPGGRSRASCGRGGRGAAGRAGRRAPALGGAATPDLRARPAALSPVRRRDARRRVHYPTARDRPDSDPPAPPCAPRPARARATAPPGGCPHRHLGVGCLRPRLWILGSGGSGCTRVGSGPPSGRILTPHALAAAPSAPGSGRQHRLDPPLQPPCSLPGRFMQPAVLWEGRLKFLFRTVIPRPMRDPTVPGGLTWKFLFRCGTFDALDACSKVLAQFGLRVSSGSEPGFYRP